MPEREGTVNPFAFIEQLAAAGGFSTGPVTGVEDTLKQRVDSVFAAGRGSLYSAHDGNTKRISDCSSPDEVWNTLIEGGCWIDDERGFASLPRFSLLGSSTNAEQMKAALYHRHDGLLLMAGGWRNAINEGQSAPIMSKVFQESELRPLGGEAFINPQTCLALGLEDGGMARVQTQLGSMEVRVHYDAGVVPRMVQVTVGPAPNGNTPVSRDHADGVLSLCQVRDDGTWKVTEATVEGVSS
jgi:hypothetical protein